MLKELPKEGIQMNEIEKLIIDARLTGLAFTQLEEGKLRAITDEIILKTASYSGCLLPQTEFFAEIISNSIIDFFEKSAYGQLSVAEVFLALHFNVRHGLKWPIGMDIEQVQFVGSVFHLDFFSKVLTNYMALRNSLDRKLQNFIDGY